MRAILRIARTKFILTIAISCHEPIFFPLDLRNHPSYLSVITLNLKGEPMKTTKQYGKKIDLALSMWVKLTRAHDTFNHLTAENIRSFGLTAAQFGVIECLGHLGTMLIGDLTKKHLVSGGNMTVIVNNLEKDGFVKRLINEDDRRAFYVKLTPKGMRLFKKIFSKHAQYITKLASVLSEAEQEELGILLKKLGTCLHEVS